MNKDNKNRSISIFLLQQIRLLSNISPPHCLFEDSFYYEERVGNKQMSFEYIVILCLHITFPREQFTEL